MFVFGQSVYRKRTVVREMHDFIGIYPHNGHGTLLGAIMEYHVQINAGR